LFREARQQQREDNGTERSVQQVMMVTLIEVSGFSTQRRVREIQQQPKPIGVRQNSRESHEAAIAQVVGCFRADNPTAKQMRQRGHEECLSEQPWWSESQCEG
jgi:hypothetical protein